MPKSPLINAALAFVYIVCVVLVIWKLSYLGTDAELAGGLPLLLPMTMLSLFTLSAAVMGYLFLYEPGSLFFDGKKKEAAVYFLKTVAIFACIVFVLLSILAFNGVM